MRVRVFPADEGGCGYVRLIWVAEVLQTAGHQVEVVPVRRTGMALRAHLNGGHVVSVDHPDADVCVFQRPLQRSLVETIPLLQARGVAVVVEVDDDFASLPASNRAFAVTHPRRNPDFNWNMMAAAARAADLVTVSTPALAERYGRPGTAQVVPNYIPARYLTLGPGEPNPRPVVGWSGTLLSHHGDLEVTRGQVARAVQANGAAMRIIGPQPERAAVQRALGLAEPPEVTGWLPITDYPAALARLDLGIVPLADNRFNAAKTALKGLEMAACGVPFVASATVEYRRLAALGAGRLAAKPKDWGREVGRLLRDRALREELAAQGRAVAADLTIEANAWRTWEAWDEALQRRRRAAVAVG
jgi:glycosyltransferase involved in cell wall biosynthesis